MQKGPLEENVNQIRLIVVLALICLGFSSQLAGATAPFIPDRLRCEYLNNPLGIDILKPRLSWELTLFRLRLETKNKPPTKLSLPPANFL